MAETKTEAAAAQRRGLHLPLAVLALVASYAAGACLTPTQVTLHLTTNAHCPESSVEGDHFIAAQIVAGPTGDESVPWGKATDCRGSDKALNDLGTLVFIPKVDDEALLVTVVAAVRPLNGAALDENQCLDLVVKNKMKEGDPCIVARRRLGFISHTKLELDVELDTRCIGKVCEKGSTCFAGSCVSESAICDANHTDCKLPVESSTSSTGTGIGGAGGAPSTSTATGQGGACSGPVPLCTDATCATYCLACAQTTEHMCSMTQTCLCGPAATSSSISSGISSSVSTSASTVASTSASTSASTAASTSASTAASTSASTAASTSASTSGPGGSTSSSTGGGLCDALSCNTSCFPTAGGCVMGGCICCDAVPTFMSQNQCESGCDAACMSTCGLHKLSCSATGTCTCG